MPKTPASIRSIPCSACRRRKAACERDVQTEDPCRWCLDRGLTCDAAGGRVAALENTSARLANQDAEIRAQIARLEAVVQNLERRKSLTRKEASSQEETGVAIDSLVANLHAIVIQDGSELEGEANDPLFEAAKEQLGVQSPSTIDLSFRTQETTLSFDDLVSRLPSPSRIQLLLNSVWTTLIDDLYAPDYPLRVAQNLEGRTFDPGTLGELFANIALIHSALASRYAVDVAASAPHQAEADKYVGYAKRCLELADEQDSLEILRTMFTLAIIYLAVYKGSEKLASGHRLWPPICAMLLRLGYNRLEPASLTPTERYERRAIAHAVFVEHLHWCLVYGKRRQLFARDLQVPAREALRDEDLPVELHQSPFRISVTTAKKHRIWLELARLDEAVQADFEGTKVIQHSVVKRYSQRLDEVEAQIPMEWRRPADILTVKTLSDTCAHSVLMAGVRKLRVYLHRPFVAYRNPSPELSADDILWHRTEMLRTMKELVSVMPVYTEIGGPWTAHGYTSMDCIISSLLIALLDPDRPDVQEARSAAQLYVEKNRDASQAPMAVQRLVRLLSLLLVNPRTMEDASQSAKRARGGLTGIMLSTPTAVSSSDTPPSFDFSFSSPLYGLKFDLDEEDVQRRMPIIDFADALLDFEG